MPDSRRCYIAVFISERSINAPNISPLYEECFTLIKASSLEDAHQKAVEYASNTVNTSYLNIDGQTVTWLVKQISVTDALNNPDLNDDAIDLYVRGFENYEMYQSLFSADTSESQA